MGDRQAHAIRLLSTCLHAHAAAQVAGCAQHRERNPLGGAPPPELHAPVSAVDGEGEGQEEEDAEDIHAVLQLRAGRRRGGGGVQVVRQKQEQALGWTARAEPAAKETRPDACLQRREAEMAGGLQGTANVRG